MLETPIYNEIRKIDARPLTATPEPGSLGDLIKNSGLKPFTNYISHSTSNTTTFVTACSLSGKGVARVMAAHGYYDHHVRVTVDGVLVFGGVLRNSSANYNQVWANLGDFAFNSSFIVEHSYPDDTVAEVKIAYSVS